MQEMRKKMIKIAKQIASNKFYPPTIRRLAEQYLATDAEIEQICAGYDKMVADLNANIAEMARENKHLHKQLRWCVG